MGYREPAIPGGVMATHETVNLGFLVRVQAGELDWELARQLGVRYAPVPVAFAIAAASPSTSPSVVSHEHIQRTTSASSSQT